MKVAIVTESFLPTINGVTNSVTKTLDYLHSHGHQATIIAPGLPGTPTTYQGFPITTVPAINLPPINSLPIGIPTPTIHHHLRTFQPDIVHLASPFALGAAAIFACRRLHLPTIAIFQTNIADFATHYHLSPLKTAAWRWTTTIHNHCNHTLAPSTSTSTELHNHGITNTTIWGRGVDTTLFHPDNRTRPPATTTYRIGYVGRLAAEKNLHRLQTLTHLPHTELIIVGTGPLETELRKLLPTATFLGQQTGTTLAETYANLDIFIHPGEFETFCQTIQEAHASGVPTIAPNAGGPIDLIIPGYNGHLLNTETFERDLPAAIEKIRHPETHARMSHNARAGVENRSWDVVCGELMAHYEMVLENQRSMHHLR